MEDNYHYNWYLNNKHLYNLSYRDEYGTHWDYQEHGSLFDTQEQAQAAALDMLNNGTMTEHEYKSRSIATIEEDYGDYWQEMRV